MRNKLEPYHMKRYVDIKENKNADADHMVFAEPSVYWQWLYITRCIIFILRNISNNDNFCIIIRCIVSFNDKMSLNSFISYKPQYV